MPFQGVGYRLATLPHPPDEWIFWGRHRRTAPPDEGGSRAGRVTAAHRSFMIGVYRSMPFTIGSLTSEGKKSIFSLNKWSREEASRDVQED